MDEQRLIYAEELQNALAEYHILDEAPIHVAATVEQYIDETPTIDLETLPIVQELRAKLSRYEQAEQEGRLVMAPDKLYDLIYDEEAPEKSYITEYNTDGVAIKFAGDYISADELGKTVFLTREEAEAALKERENNG